MARKVSTIKVEEVKQLLQGMIDHAETEEARLALASALGDILIRTGNYHGCFCSDWLSTGGVQGHQDKDPESTAPDLWDYSKVTFY